MRIKAKILGFAVLALLLSACSGKQSGTELQEQTLNIESGGGRFYNSEASIVVGCHGGWFHCHCQGDGSSDTLLVLSRGRFL